MLKLMAITLVILMALPVQTIWAASGKMTTKVKHKPSNDEYIPGFRIQLDARLKTRRGYWPHAAILRPKRIRSSRLSI